MNQHTWARRISSALIPFAVFILASCSDSSEDFGERIIEALENACVVSSVSKRQFCGTQCKRLGDTSAQVLCDTACADEESVLQSQCVSAAASLPIECRGFDCAAQVNACMEQTYSGFEACKSTCGAGNAYCENRCLAEKADAQTTCGFAPATVQLGSLTLPVYPSGAPAVLAGTLEDAELAVVAAADERARSHRQREVRLVTGEPGAEVSIMQIEHDFRFGVPLDSREFEEGDGRLAFYGDIARQHTSLLVAETSLKWRNTEREAEQLTFDLADFELAWAESLGFAVKAHVLLWGNAPPFSSGSGTPDWLRDRFIDENLSDADKQTLRALIRSRIDTVVSRYSGRINVWEVTNEMLNPLTSWFVDRLGPSIVDDAFRWAREADPGVELVYNEWISDIFTGLGGPDAVAVRDRVLELLDRGVQIDALGQQGHFAPGLVNVGIDEGLDQRTRVDDYAKALNTLAETGLPIHITEVTFAAPQEPELRAAQAEAIMRIWWGHPQVEEIIFWNFWNPLGPRSRLNLGLYSADGNLTRHGEAILSLLNDRWRTRVQTQLDEAGATTFTGTYGKYTAQWSSPKGPVHIQFEVPKGSGRLLVIASD